MPETQVTESIPANLAHTSQCVICQSEYKEDIDYDYLNWLPIKTVCEKYKVADWTLRRHAKSTGLEEKKNLNLKAYWLRIMKMKTNDVPKYADKIKASELLAKAVRILEPENNVNVAVINVVNYKDAKRDNTPISIPAEIVPTPTA
jgi:hypothetical protein